ncbi:MAG: hypothetical protein IJQ26_02350 [Lachnospiraceae bacterium]|nr:hypothetical protein [Lachnospiraceae bacterium]
MISTTEIILVFIGLISVIVGYVMPAGMSRVDGEADAEKARRSVRAMVRRSLEEARSEIRERLDDTLEETMVKSERSMERITNDRINAISNYADTVLDDIHKNHDEVMFMYDMLSDKHKNLTTLVSDVSKSAEEARQTARDAELTVKATIESAKATMETANAAMEDVKAARDELEIALAKSREVSGADPYAHAEVALPDMSRLDEDWFAPFAQDIPHIDPVQTPARVLQSETPDETEAESLMAAEMVANALSSKVVPITSGQRHEQKPLTAESASVSGSLAYATEAVPMTRDRQSLILEMHQLGRSNVAIARELGVGVGEVRLVIDLFSKGRKAKRA